ncbi:hypothetical protein HDU79_001005 [Rhizoclosmatium sp. JEL0117]|nr:hypothetical protein HDU79_001005 [Rhizoclosmatium sp. JEL0117]
MLQEVRMLQYHSSYETCDDVVGPRSIQDDSKRLGTKPTMQPLCVTAHALFLLSQFLPAFEAEIPHISIQWRYGIVCVEGVIGGIVVFYLPLFSVDCRPRATFPVIPQTRRHRNPKSKEYTRTDRFRASDSEVALLNAVFSASPFPSVELREAIAAKLGLTSTQVRFWFQNRRVQLKKQGVHVIKPRKNGVLGYAGALKPVEGASPFFFVEDLK